MEKAQMGTRFSMCTDIGIVCGLFIFFEFLCFILSQLYSILLLLSLHYLFFLVRHFALIRG
jgi:hypothetical protein